MNILATLARAVAKLRARRRRFKGRVVRIPCDSIRVTVTKVEVGRA